MKSTRELERLGVEVVDRRRVVFKCKTCGTTWSPNVQTGGRMPRGYWKCPNGCNAGEQSGEATGQ